MVYILIAILIFGVLIAVHEFGHFLAAKACGVRVNEFSIGMGPHRSPAVRYPDSTAWYPPVLPPRPSAMKKICPW